MVRGVVQDEGPRCGRHAHANPRHLRMQLFQLLTAADPELRAEECKIHLACWNGREDPLDVYLEGKFDEWQEWQSKRNFERPRIVSLIQIASANNLWLFAGTYDSQGCSAPNERRMVRYRTTRRPGGQELDGRLVVHFDRTGRASYLLAENWLEQMAVHEISAKKTTIGEFPGFAGCTVSKAHLDLIVKQRIESWRAALSGVSGIYVIADRTTGKLYVGSASGDGGLWQRWCEYSETGHAGNAKLRALLAERGEDHAANFQFGVLEIAGTHGDDLIDRETYWKKMLLTREFGHNDN